LRKVISATRKLNGKVPSFIRKWETSEVDDIMKLANKTLHDFLRSFLGEVKYRIDEVITVGGGVRGHNVRLTIQVDSYSLVKNYRGPYGFPEFLEDFADGTKRFTISEFPLYEDRLAEWDIEYFDLQFGLRGHGKVIDVLSASRQRLPRYIVN
jgi:hypothetical protein